MRDITIKDGASRLRCGTPTYSNSERLSLLNICLNTMCGGTLRTNTIGRILLKEFYAHQVPVYTSEKSRSLTKFHVFQIWDIGNGSRNVNQEKVVKTVFTKKATILWKFDARVDAKTRNGLGIEPSTSHSWADETFEYSISNGSRKSGSFGYSKTKN